jgi:predicted enzyme related to lactoylglutathione lyase
MAEGNVENTPIWFDLSSTDADGSRSFYSKLFGWTADVIPDPQAGGYGFFNLDGKMVGGVGPVQNPGQPTSWSSYICVRDAATAAEKARQAGGTVMVEPMDVMGQGTLAFVSDPSGAAIGLWQPAEHQGAEVRGVPGSAAWTELHSNDINGVKGFYRSLFGWDTHDTDMGGMKYTEFKIGDASVAGGTALGPGEEHAPSHWLIYFAVADVDESSANATDLGGSAIVPPMDFPGGRFSVIRDPQGAMFGLLRMSG